MDDKELFSKLEEFPSPEELFRMDEEPERERTLPEEKEKAEEIKESKEEDTSGKTQDFQDGESRKAHWGVKIFLIVFVMLLLAAAVVVLKFERVYAGNLRFVVQRFS